MSEDGTTTPDPSEDAPFDLSNVTPLDVPVLDVEPDPADAPGVPDHTASNDEPSSLIERVRKRAQENATKDAPKSAPKVKKQVPKTRPGALVRPLVEVYTSIGVVMIPFDAPCGTAVIDNAEKCATALDALAQRNDSVRRALLAITETSAWGGVLSAHLPLLLMIATHHGPKNVADTTAPLAFMMNSANPLFAQPQDAGQDGAA